MPSGSGRCQTGRKRLVIIGCQEGAQKVSTGYPKRYQQGIQEGINRVSQEGINRVSKKVSTGYPRKV